MFDGSKDILRPAYLGRNTCRSKIPHNSPYQKGYCALKHINDPIAMNLVCITRAEDDKTNNKEVFQSSYVWSLTRVLDIFVPLTTRFVDSLSMSG